MLINESWRITIPWGNKPSGIKDFKNFVEQDLEKINRCSSSTVLFNTSMGYSNFSRPTKRLSHAWLTTRYRIIDCPLFCLLQCTFQVSIFHQTFQYIQCIFVLCLRFTVHRVAFGVLTQNESKWETTGSTKENLFSLEDNLICHMTASYWSQFMKPITPAWSFDHPLAPNPFRAAH